MKLKLYSVCVCEKDDPRLKLINEEVEYVEEVNDQYLYFPKRELSFKLDSPISFKEAMSNCKFEIANRDGDLRIIFNVPTVDAVYGLEGIIKAN